MSIRPLPPSPCPPLFFAVVVISPLVPRLRVFDRFLHLPPFFSAVVVVSPLVPRICLFDRFLQLPVLPFLCHRSLLLPPVACLYIMVRCQAKLSSPIIADILNPKDGNHDPPPETHEHAPQDDVATPKPRKTSRRPNPGPPPSDRRTRSTAHREIDPSPVTAIRLPPPAQRHPHGPARKVPVASAHESGTSTIFFDHSR